MWLYRYYDRAKVLLYVGIASDVGRRAVEHATGSRWWRFVESADARWMARVYARPCEQRLIRLLRPVFNVAHARPSARQAAVEYCAHREAWDLVDEMTRYRPNVDPGPHLTLHAGKIFWA